jgi:hypothetical protein
MTNINQMSLEDMKKKLDSLYVKCEALEEEIRRLVILREQTIDDIEMAETLLMFQLNKRDRLSELING